MPIKIKVLPAFNGDCFLLQYNTGNPCHILIDGGTVRTFTLHLEKNLRKIKQNGYYLDKVILTHIDDDHIGGLLQLFQSELGHTGFIKDVWFNSREVISRLSPSRPIIPYEIPLPVKNKTEMSAKQAITLEQQLIKHSLWKRDIISYDSEFIIKGAKIKILAPQKDMLQLIILQYFKWLKKEYDDDKQIILPNILQVKEMLPETTDEEIQIIFLETEKKYKNYLKENKNRSQDISFEQLPFKPQPPSTISGPFIQGADTSKQNFLNSTDEERIHFLRIHGPEQNDNIHSWWVENGRLLKDCITYNPDQLLSTIKLILKEKKLYAFYSYIMSALDKMAKMYFYPEKHNKDDISKINSCLLPEYMLDIAFKILDTFVF